MRLTQKSKAISGLSLILLMLVSTIIGALISYLWVVGYYENLRIRTPEESDVTITNATFFPQNTRFFKVTIFNPSYSPSDAVITRIAASTKDGRIHNITTTYPPLPYTVRKATKDFPGNQTFECMWNWANHTGETIGIVAFLAEGSGPTLEVETPFVDLSVAEINFDPSVSVTRFNMTVENSNSSITHVDVSKIAVRVEGEAAENVTEVTAVTPTLPQTINSSESVSFVCSWNWTDYQGKNVTIVVNASQGYVAYYPKPPERTALPPPTDIQITDVLFNAANTTCFNVTVRNSEDSPTYVNITGIEVAVDYETFPDLPVIPPPSLPYTLHPGAEVTFKCSWNWTDYRDKIVGIFIHTLQNFTESHIKSTTGPVILTITDMLFDVSDMNHFNLTVQYSPFSLEEYVNITSIRLETVKSQLITETDPNYLNYTLERNDSVTFKCEWNWTSYRGENVTIRVYVRAPTLQEYFAHFTRSTPEPIIMNITRVSFNISDTTHFNVTAENSQYSLDYILIMNITTTLENGAVEGRRVVPSTALPYVLHPNQSVNLKCVWDWSNYRGKNVTVTVHTLQDYSPESTQLMPFVITEVLFNDTERFAITVKNSATSITYANITEITVTVKGEAPENVTQVTPLLPHTLYPNQSESFVCRWNWTNYEGRNVAIAIHTLQGYTAYAFEVIPERVVLEVVDIIFNVTDTTHFNITVRSSELSLIEANITEITITIDEIAQNVTEVIPSLPCILQPDASVTFKCSWDWTDCQGKTVTITMSTLRGYVTSTEYTIPTVP